MRNAGTVIDSLSRAEGPAAAAVALVANVADNRGARRPGRAGVERGRRRARDGSTAARQLGARLLQVRVVEVHVRAHHALDALERDAEEAVIDTGRPAGAGSVDCRGDRLLALRCVSERCIGKQVMACGACMDCSGSDCSFVALRLQTWYD